MFCCEGSDVLLVCVGVWGQAVYWVDMIEILPCWRGFPHRKVEWILASFSSNYTPSVQFVRLCSAAIVQLPLLFLPLSLHRLSFDTEMYSKLHGPTNAWLPKRTLELRQAYRHLRALISSTVCVRLATNWVLGSFSQAELFTRLKWNSCGHYSSRIRIPTDPFG